MEREQDNPFSLIWAADQDGGVVAEYLKYIQEK